MARDVAEEQRLAQNSAYIAAHGPANPRRNRVPLGESHPAFATESTTIVGEGKVDAEEVAGTLTEPTAENLTGPEKDAILFEDSDQMQVIAPVNTESVVVDPAEAEVAKTDAKADDKPAKKDK